MKIIQKANEGHRFEVTRSFRFINRLVAPPEILEDVKEPDATAGVLVGRIKPVMRDPDVYQVVTAELEVPGSREKFVAKRNELVELRAADALPLMLRRLVIPRDPETWRPFGLKLVTKTASQLEREKAARIKARDEAVWDQKFYEAGIHPAQKRK